MTPKLKKIILIILVLAVLFVAYAIFIKEDPEQDPFITNTFNATQDKDTQVLGAQITQALLRIEQVQLDKKIFDSEVYKSLQDRSVSIVDEPVGRANPFAPIGISGVSNSNSNATTTATSTATTSLIRLEQ